MYNYVPYAASIDAQTFFRTAPGVGVGVVGGADPVTFTDAVFGGVMPWKQK